MFLRSSKKHAPMSVLLLAAVMFVSAHVRASESSASATFMEQGIQHFQRGAFEQAAESWLEASRHYEQAGKLSEQTEALIALAQAYQALGHYNKALQSLQSALPLVEKTDDRLKLARIKGVAGNLYLASGQAAEAATHSHEGLQLARERGTSAL